MQEQAALGAYLQSRRARLSPEDVGLTRYDDRRRVPGLRREEIAQLAGVSASYYTRLEQGQSLNASAEVLDALARALLLDQYERTHLHDLARTTKKRKAAQRPAAERVSPASRDLLRAMGDVPAIITGRRCDVLAWNRMGHALFAGHLDFTSPDRPADRPNTAKLVFLDQHNRDLFVDWKSKARAMTEHLRLVAGRHPEDKALAALIGELSMKSPEFAALWTEHRVHPCELAVFELRHPLVGTLTVTQQTLGWTLNPDHSLVVVTTEAGSPSEAALLLLAHLTANGR
ncbi:helix-turn-helix domain-containing protein [Nonomuraea lactucae]|uniref:helix-turn-helix domain-containing protein n=1 Tax=Nonomuraea lactucae TaxID=2249762 RepID=UPI000DE29CA1|nr:helix-turn-helix transcriptional regulator [Nonomuraea lactucae]